MMILYETKLKESQVRKENEKCSCTFKFICRISSFEKTLQNAELITQEAYQLYRNLQTDDDSSSKTALKIAGEVHEIKRIIKGFLQDYLNCY